MKVFVIAGEASGDRLGAAVMASLRHARPECRFEGIGGHEMCAEGLVSLFPMQELSVMGLAEILPRYLHLRRRLRQTIDAIIAAQPDLLLTIDSPGFCFRVLEGVRGRIGAHRAHYVAPTVWAWKPKRAAKLAQLADQCLALLPFEPPYFEAEGMRCDFVGHPVVSLPPPDPETVARLRADWGRALCILPGSRLGEVRRLLPIFREVRARLDHALTTVIPAAPGLEPVLQEALAGWPGRVELVNSGDVPKLAAFAACDGALAASGTVSLELAAARVPMVIGYDMAWLSRVILQRLVRLETVTLVNLVSQSRAVPEFIGAECRAEAIAPAVQDVLRNPTPQLAAMDLTMERLGRGGVPPAERAARALLEAIDG